jgi:hypothetical protein
MKTPHIWVWDLTSKRWSQEHYSSGDWTKVAQKLHELGSGVKHQLEDVGDHVPADQEQQWAHPLNAASHLEVPFLCYPWKGACGKLDMNTYLQVLDPACANSFHPNIHCHKVPLWLSCHLNNYGNLEPFRTWISHPYIFQLVQSLWVQVLLQIISSITSQTQH